jgi:hypothetical protein
MLHFPILMEGPSIALGVTAYIIGLTISEIPDRSQSLKGINVRNTANHRTGSCKKILGNLALWWNSRSSPYILRAQSSDMTANFGGGE